MNTIPCRALLALSIAAAVSVSATAASFHIQSVEPVAAVRGVSPPAMTADFTVTAPGTTPDWTTSIEGNPSERILLFASGVIGGIENGEQGGLFILLWRPWVPLIAGGHDGKR